MLGDTEAPDQNDADHMTAGAGFTESLVEDAALAWLGSLGWWVSHGLENAPGESKAECFISRGR
jgi:hypothetical protein